MDEFWVVFDQGPWDGAEAQLFNEDIPDSLWVPSFHLEGAIYSTYPDLCDDTTERQCETGHAHRYEHREVREDEDGEPYHIYQHCSICPVSDGV